LVVGIDANAQGMSRSSQTAERERLANALFVAAAVEALPAELCGAAHEVSIRLPWGSLLSAVAAPDIARLASVRALWAASASLQVWFSWDAERDARELARLGLENVGGDEWQLKMAAGYESAGFHLASLRRGDTSMLDGLGTTWARRLRAGR